LVERLHVGDFALSGVARVGEVEVGPFEGGDGGAEGGEFGGRGGFEGAETGEFGEEFRVGRSGSERKRAWEEEEERC
jgi:hypothetical protein